MEWEKPVLSYRRPPRPRPLGERIPWGLVSMILALTAATVMVMGVGFFQLPADIRIQVMCLDCAAALVALFSGLRALAVKSERSRGIVGCIVAMAVLMLAR